MDDDKDRDKHTGPGEAVEEHMPELDELPGEARERDERGSTDADRRRRDSNAD